MKALPEPMFATRLPAARATASDYTQPRAVTQPVPPGLIGWAPELGNSEKAGGQTHPLILQASATRETATM